jgi:antitoxin MazE
MKARIVRCGNSLTVSIPKTVIKQIGLHPKAEVELSVHDGKIILTTQKTPRYTLEALLEGITDENRHEEWGSND